MLNEIVQQNLSLLNQFGDLKVKSTSQQSA